MNDENRISVPAILTEDGFLQSKETGEIIEPSNVLKNADIYITEAKTDTITNLATGIAINQYEKKSWDFLREVSDFNDNESNIYKFMNVCDKLYRFEPVIGTAIDLFVNYTISNFRIVTDNEELNKVIDYLYDNVNKFIPTKNYLFAYPSGMEALAKEIASEWFISGNVFPYSEWKTQEIANKTYKIPNKIINLNPNSIRVGRSATFLGGVELFYSPGGYYVDNSNSTTINYNTAITNTGNQQALLDTRPEQPLDHKKVYHIKRKYSGYKLWGIPYLTRTFSAVKSKRKLRYLDDTTIEGLANYIIIFKLGSPDKDSPYHKVTANRLSAFRGLIENPQASNMIVWPHDIDVITVGPDGKVLDFKDRYEVVDRDIIRSLGVPPVLLDGTGSSGVNWVPILALIERLEDVRDAVTDYFSYLVNNIAITNSLSYEKLEVRWAPSNLRDEQQVKTFLLSFYDRGLLPVETTLEQLNYKTDDIVELKKKEKKEKYSELFARPDVPFSPIANKSGNNRSGDTGRQPDNTFNEPKDAAKSSITGTFVDTVTAELDILHQELRNVRKVDVGISNLVLARFMRIKNITDIFVDMEIHFVNGSKDEELFKTYKDFVYAALDSIREEFVTNLTDNLLYLRKESVANFVTAGVFSDCKDKIKVFCDNVLYATSIFINLSDNITAEVYISSGKETVKTKTNTFFENINFNDVKNIIYRFV